MVSLEKDMAVIGAVNELLLQKQNPIFINSNIIYQYVRMMEARSGYAVVRGFSTESLYNLLKNKTELFQYDLCESFKCQEPTYRVLYADSDCFKNIKEFIIHMIDALDPALNYPYDFLESMRLIDALECLS